MTDITCESEEKHEVQESSFLEEIREKWPLLSPHWGKIETLTPFQAVLLFYEIEPLDENCNFSFMQEFIAYGDEKAIWPLLENSLRNGSLLQVNGQLRTHEFYIWLIEKSFQPPKVFDAIREEFGVITEEKSPIIIRNLDDVQLIDYNSFSDSVLKAFTANVIAQIRRRKDHFNNKTMKVSDVLNSQLLKKSMEELSFKNNKIPSQHTVREYIAKQFKSPIPED